MSQEPPNSQPESHNSATPPRPLSQSAQTQGKSLSVVLKTQTLKILRGTIRVLEGVVVKLEAEPEGTSEPSWLDKLPVAWSGVLAKIRSLLPQNLSSVSDTVLTGIIASVCVILVWTTSSLLSGKPPQVATAPNPDLVSTPTPTIPTPPDIEPSPTIPTPPDIEPSPNPTSTTPPDIEPSPTIPTPLDIEPSPNPTSTTPPDIEPSPTIPTPPELTAPAEPQPVAVTPLPEPEPTVELTPEQTLIAAIENQVALVSDRFADGLIQSIQANFEASSLTLKVGNDWYNLKPSQQDKLAAQMLERSKELDFTRLEIIDSQGTLLARSPVVGKDMVIFIRG